MMLHIPQVLTAEQVAQMRQHLLSASWQEGVATAGVQAAQVKHNWQIGRAHV